MYIAQPTQPKKNSGSEPPVEPEPEIVGSEPRLLTPFFLAGELGSLWGFFESVEGTTKHWIPACAGMTVSLDSGCRRDG